ncbi:hypothetical protein [Sphingomonas lenta]|uniref:Uncharacterized protein n=1 Tax=Sphingomonas lenta TaxID=1141887 RepID=A0A2A2SD62_9SPHN|nr:hypothetical protein [Sphingomonas lenta]PAX07189.1 hypothetical protein CKY28_14225 [Sphingomonas lenta]
MKYVIGALALAAAGGAAAQSTERPALLSRLVDCRKLTADAERLRCYDAQVSALDEAERKREVVVVDRAQVREARRSLFGLTLPKIRLFGDRDDGPEEPEFAQIETTLKDAAQAGGRWRFTLADGANWVQTDSEELARTPRPGQAIRIRKGALGSFLANVERQPAIRVKRVN